MATQQDNSSVSDEKLVRRSQRGDMVAFEELVLRHRDKIYARAFSMMRNEEEAVDLSQEAWVKGWQRLKQFHWASGGQWTNGFGTPVGNFFPHPNDERSGAR